MHSVYIDSLPICLALNICIVCHPISFNRINDKQQHNMLLSSGKNILI